MKVVIVGGVAGGATAAARLRRLDEHAQVIVFERSGYVSYANCGLPYYIGGTIADPSALTLQTVSYTHLDVYKRQPCCFVEHVLHGVQANGHLGDLELVELEATDGLAECLALIGVTQRIFICADRVAVVAGTYQPALEVEVGDAAVEAIAFCAEDIRLIEFHVVEVDLAAAIHA